MGSGVGVRRAEDASRSEAADEAGEPAQRDAAGRVAGDVRAGAGAFRDAGADGAGGGDRAAGSGPAVVLGLPADPEVPAAGVPGADSGGVGGLVSSLAGGNGGRAHR